MTLTADNPMRSVLLSVLIFEVIVFGLAIPVMIFSAVPVEAAVLLGGSAALLALLGAGLLRRPVGYLIGWVTQLAGVALGFATSAMFAVGAIFLALWVLSFVLGKRIEAIRRAGPAGR